jgi:hypothetical protein
MEILGKVKFLKIFYRFTILRIKTIYGLYVSKKQSSDEYNIHFAQK